MKNTRDHIDPDILAAYALDALAPDEIVDVGAHLATCAHCQRELASLRTTAGLIPYALPTAEPVADLRGRIIDRARATRDGAAPAPAARPVMTQPSRRQWNWWPRLAPALAALTLVLGFLFGQAWQSRQTTNLANRPGAQLASLGGHGSFVVLPSHGAARLVVTNLPQLQPGQVYQLWLLGASAPISAGTFEVDAQGRGELDWNGLAWSTIYSGIAITQEPPGGSAGPTSSIVVQGEF